MHAPPHNRRVKSRHQNVPAEKKREEPRPHRRQHSQHPKSSRHHRIPDVKPTRATAPTTPRRSSSVTTKLRKQARTPLKSILHSAKRFSRSIFPAARGMPCDSSGGDNDGDDEGGCYSDDGHRSVFPTPIRRKTTGLKHDVDRTSSQITPDSRTSASAGDGRGATYMRRCEKNDRGRPRERHLRLDHRHPTLREFKGATSTHMPNGNDTDGGEGSEASRSDLSDYEGNQDILKMNGLLDVWDAKGNPRWEEEAFALCDLSRCQACGKYYAPMRTLRHVCRV